MSTDVTEVQSGLEGVVAFATEIAEPDREGGALRYRGVDIEELVGAVPFEQVWGLLVDGSFEPGLPPAEPHPLTDPLGRSARRRAERAGDARPRVGLRAAHRHHRRAGARRPRARLGHGAEVRRAVGARRRAPARPADRRRPRDQHPRALPHPLARRGRPRPREGDRRLLDLGRRARHERLDLHRPRRRLDRRRRRRGAVERRRRPERAAARRRSVARAEDARRGASSWATPSAGSRTRSTAASG